MITLCGKHYSMYAHSHIGNLDRGIIEQPIIHWEINGEYSLTFKYALTGTFVRDIEEDCQIEVDSYEQSNYFIVKQVLKRIDHVEVFCEQKSIVLIDNLVSDVRKLSVEASDALYAIDLNMAYNHGLEITTDQREPSRGDIDIESKNGLEALLDDRDEGSYVYNFGGEVERKFDKVTFHDRIGEYRGITIRYGKDLLGYTATIDNRNVCTRIKPIGPGGVTLPELYVDSPNIDTRHPVVRVFEYDTESKDEEGIRRELRNLAAKEFSENHIDEPICTYDIDFVLLSRTTKYEHMGHFQEIRGGDTVRVIHKENKIDVSARCVAYDYDPLTKTYLSIRLSNNFDSSPKKRKGHNLSEREYSGITHTASGDVEQRLKDMERAIRDISSSGSGGASLSRIENRLQTLEETQNNINRIIYDEYGSNIRSDLEMLTRHMVTHDEIESIVDSLTQEQFVDSFSIDGSGKSYVTCTLSSPQVRGIRILVVHDGYSSPYRLSWDIYGEKSYVDVIEPDSDQPTFSHFVYIPPGDEVSKITVEKIPDNRYSDLRSIKNIHVYRVPGLKMTLDDLSNRITKLENRK